MSTNPYNEDKRLLELLERWQTGDFTRADEQELQALADSDAFRREAVEGFWAMPEADHTRHLDTLRKRLRARTGSGRRIALPQMMMAAAAISILVLAVVWLMPNEQKSESIAQSEPATSPTELPPASTDGNQNFAAEPEAIGNTATRSSSPGAGALSSSEPESSQAAPEPSTPADLAMEKTAESPAIYNAKENPATDKVVAAKPVLEDNEARVAMDEADDIDRGMGNAAPASKAQKQEAAKIEQASQKKKASGKASAPSGGWNNFQEYLRRNARLPEAARQNNISGTVRLKFQLDANAQPTDIQVLRALGFGCEEEAIRLVKAYKWERGANPEISVDVPFVR